MRRQRRDGAWSMEPKTVEGKSKSCLHIPSRIKTLPHTSLLLLIRTSIMFRRVASIAAALLCIFGSLGGEPFATAFQASPLQLSSASSATTLFASRRAVLEASITATLSAMAITSPVWAAADVDDLSMPSEEEQKKAEEDAMKERLRKKAELQKAASKPATFQESMAAEVKKQESLKKSQMERRNAMCEELGRGC